MKKVLVLLAMVLGATNMFAQNLTEKFIMGQLPTTADDFQKYQFDYKLECVQDVGYDYDVYVPQSSFDGTNIFPLERNEVPIKSMECTVVDNGSTLFRLKADFTSSGKVNNYLRKIGSSAKYQFGTDTWYQKEWTSVGLTPCVPNSFACWTSPTKNSKGLIVSVSTDLQYKYDSNDRVIEVRYHDNEFIYRYSYEGDSKKISTISVSYKDKEVATVRYTWQNDRISKLYCHIDYTSKFSNMFDEYEKSYKYDSHNNVSVIEYREIHGSQWNRKIYEFNNEYNAKGQLSFQNVVYRKTTAWDIERGKPEETRTHTRSYMYDENGNWVKMIENRNGAQSVMERKIVYSNKKVGEVDINNIYDEEEVEIHATFGATLRDNFRKNGISFDGNIWPYLGDLIVNIRFVVGRDGRTYFYDEPHTNNERIDAAISNKVIPYIQALPWVPATINGTFVNSITSLSWKYNKTENSNSVQILKDVTFTSTEKKHFENNYSKFESIKLDIAKAEKLENLKKLSKERKPAAMLELAKKYLIGEDVDKDSTNAFDMLLDLATEKVPASYTYKNEAISIVVQNQAEIFRNSNFVKRLANSKFQKNVIEPDPLTEMCMEASVATGNKELIYERIKIAKNHEQNYIKWLKWAAYYNDDDAKYELALFYLDGSSDYYDVNAGVALLTSLADNGYSMACQKLGNMYKYGLHVEKDKKKAKYYLKR